MPETSDLREHIGRTLLAHLDETFVQVEGYYLDKGTSLLETLATLTPSEASVPVSDSGASIAGHIAHVRFYMEAIIKTMRGQEVGKLDWEQSWLVHSVTAEEWDALRATLQAAYQEVRGLVESFATGEGKEDVEDAVAVIVHTAYHLGAIRLAMHWIRSGAEVANPGK